MLTMPTMPGIETLLQQPAPQAVGWALLQFVWQGAAIGALTALALAILRRGAADVRYIVAAISLALMLTLPIVTAAQKFQALRADAAGAGPSVTLVAKGATPPSTAIALGETAASRGSAVARSADAAAWSARAMAALRDIRVEPLLPTLMLAWLIGVSMLSLRLLTGWFWIQRLRTHGVSAASDACLGMTARLSRRLHITRAITLLESTLVDVPTVIGFLKPVVLLPASVLGGLTPQQLEAILAHELAHIRRHDYMVNLLQTLVETVLFYHPAVWWVSRRIRIERENCCDDLAVSLCGDPVAYANALADLEALRGGPAPDHHIVMAATGGSLLQRVRRLLGAPASHTGRGPAWLAGSVALVLIGGIALGADGLRADRAAAADDAAQVTAPASPTQPTSRAYSRLETVPFAPPAPPAPPAAPVPPVPAAPPAQPAPAAPVAPPDTDVLLPAAAPAAPLSPFTAPVPPASEAPQATPPAPPALPATPAPPAPPAPPARDSGGQSISHQADGSHGSWSWSNNGDKLEVKYSGAFEFSDDDSDIRQMSPGGYLKITDGNWIGRHSVEFRERGGQIERRYYVNASERRFEPDGRAWLQQNLPKFVRNTGIGASTRVARFLRGGGVNGVTAEIGRIQSTYVKGIYYRELFKQATLSPAQYLQVMTQAAGEMRSSDYELAQLLIAIADKLPADEAARGAYFRAASGIRSDYELRRVYSTMLKRGAVSPQTLRAILESTASIESDYELAELLRQIVAQQPLDETSRAAFFRSVGTIGSDYERRRVLGAVVSDRQASDQGLLESALTAAAALGSDYETASFLLDVLKQNGVDGTARGPFFKAVATVSSGYERGRVLQAVVRKPGTGSETVREALRASAGMSGHELSQLLQLVARTHSVSGDLRDAYLAAAERLSGHEQDQVFAALVKNERTRR